MRARFIPTHTLERPRCIGAFSPAPPLTSLGESVSAKHAALVASILPLTEDDTDPLRIALGYNNGCTIGRMVRRRFCNTRCFRAVESVLLVISWCRP